MSKRAVTMGEVEQLCRTRVFVRYARPRTVYRRLDRYFHVWRSRVLTTITDEEVGNWYYPIAIPHPTMGGQVLGLWRLMWRKAKEFGLYPRDGWIPGGFLKRTKGIERERFVMPDEMPRVLAALEAEPMMIRLYVLLQICTSCRPGEARAMEWEHLDQTALLWRKPKTKTTAHLMTLEQTLMGAIRHLERGASPRVFPYSETYFSMAWQRVRARAGVRDIQLRDLRRTCASWLAKNNTSLPTIQKALNHKNLQHTGRYARVMVETMRPALDELTRGLLANSTVLQPSEGVDSEHGVSA